MGRHRPKNTHAANKVEKRLRKISNRRKDLDQIQDEMKKPIPLPLDEKLPGMGQYYCMSCARYFISRQVLAEHCKTSQHKRELKLALEKPYSVRESEAAAGMAPPAK